MAVLSYSQVLLIFDDLLFGFLSGRCMDLSVQLCFMQF